jgi:predicted Zn finger-like uncharacterized protein
VLVVCPKCKTRLKIPEEKIKPEGTRFKCPKCATKLLIKPPKAKAAAPAAAAPAAAPKPAQKPAAAPTAAAAPRPAPGAMPEGMQTIEAQAKEISTRKILVGHENPRIVEKIMSHLLGEGFLIIPVPHGVEAQVQAMKELPHLVILDAALPKTDGYEIIKRLRENDSAKGIKAIILTSKTDSARARKNPPEMYGVGAYLDDDEVPGGLKDAIDVALGRKQAAPAAARPAAVAPAAAAPAAARPAVAGADRAVEKAKRLARTVLSDIELYSPEKVIESIKSGGFESVFAEELREGLKHYQNRVAPEVRSKGNFFQVAIDDFIEKKKKMLGLA